MPHRRSTRPGASLLTALAFLAVLAGCGDRLTTPQPPESLGQGRWTRLATPPPWANMTALWALDEDDVWIGGYPGQFLHWDGRSFTAHGGPTDRQITSIAGRSADDVYALADKILRWDGRRWEAWPLPDWPDHFSPQCLGFDAEGRLAVGGRDWKRSSPAIVTLRGGEWVRSLVKADGLAVIDLARPDPDGPWIALTGFFLDPRGLAIDDGTGWREPAGAQPLIATHGSLVLTGPDNGEQPRTLHRIGRDGRLDVICAETAVEPPIIDTRLPLGSDFHRLRNQRDCTQTIVGDTDGFDLDFVAVPLRPGRQGRSIFASRGHPPRLLRLRWNDAGRLATDDLTVALQEEWRRSPRDAPVHDGERWIALGTYGYVTEDGPDGWRRHPESPSQLTHLERTADGGLVVWGWGRAPVGRRSPDGVWSWTADLHDGPVGAWAAPGAAAAFAVLQDGRVLEFHDGSWRERDTLGGHASHYAALSVARQYVAVRWRTGETRLAMFDGDTWRDVTPPGLAAVEDAVAQHTAGRYVVSARCADGRAALLAHDGDAWTALLDASPLVAVDLRTAPDGTIHAREQYDRRRVLRARHGKWQTVADLDDATYTGRDLVDYGVGPDCAVLVIDRQRRLHRCAPSGR